MTRKDRGRKKMMDPSPYTDVRTTMAVFSGPTIVRKEGVLTTNHERTQFSDIFTGYYSSISVHTIFVGDG